VDYLLHLLIVACVYALLAASLDLLVGQIGLLSVAHASFYGLGSYCSALLAVRVGFSFLPALAAATLFAGVMSFLVSLPSLRLRGDYFVVATLGFQLIVLSVLNNWVEVTRGPLGIANIPQPAFAGLVIQTRVGMTVLAVIVALLGYLFIKRVVSSPFGRVLRGIREDEIFVETLGKNTFQFKVTAFAVSAALAGSAGALYAHYISYIDPTSFTVAESILVLSMVIIGGAGNPWGPLLGAVVLVTLPEALRFIGLPSSVAANIRQIFYGALLILMMIARPRGLVGRYGFGG
jgi:branched-chain amino acid transport system permease protein